MRSYRLAFIAVVIWHSAAIAQVQALDEGVEVPKRDGDIVVYGRPLRQIGMATAGSQRTVGYGDLANRPLSRVGEIVENVPGLIATQHSGTGNANQYILRGFNLDHGTDLASFASLLALPGCGGSGDTATVTPTPTATATLTPTLSSAYSTAPATKKSIRRTSTFTRTGSRPRSACATVAARAEAQSEAIAIAIVMAADGAVGRARAVAQVAGGVAADQGYGGQRPGEYRQHWASGGAQGAARYGYLNPPAPVTAAGRNFNRRIDPAEFARRLTNASHCSTATTTARLPLASCHDRNAAERRSLERQARLAQSLAFGRGQRGGPAGTDEDNDG